jgi:hypothetical protein
MKWIVIVILVLTSLGIIVSAIGALLPRDHIAARTLVVHQPPDMVWSVISDFPAAPSWRKDVMRVERGPDQHGHPVWIEHRSNGILPMEVVEADVPSKLVTRIADPHMPFGGTWTYRLTSDSGGTKLTIIEEGWVSNPIFRFVSRFVMGHHATIDTYLRSIAAKFNEPASLSGH